MNESSNEVFEAFESLPCDDNQINQNILRH